MEKKNFVTLVMSVVGGVLFAIGMCMCLLPEWGVFDQGVAVSVVGLVELAVMLMVRRRMEGKSLIVRIDARTIGTVMLGLVGALVPGLGMCMTMVWGAVLMVPGIAVGLLGIVLLLCLIPLCRGLR